MAETKKSAARRAPPDEPADVSGYRDRVSEILKLLADFGKELKLSNAVLRIEVNLDALDVSPSPDYHLCSCLQAHISKLQAVSESFGTLVASDASTSSAQHNTTEDAVASSSLTERPPPCSAGAAETDDDDVTVQIRARKSEIERRISAFMERKQMEINENNVREFCNVIDCNQEDSCARTDAVFTPYPGFKSHVKGLYRWCVLADSYAGGQHLRTPDPRWRPGSRGGAAEGPDGQRLRKCSRGRTTSEHRDASESPSSWSSSVGRLPETEEAGGSDPRVGGTLAGVLSVHESPAQATQDVRLSGLQPDGPGPEDQRSEGSASEEGS
ncbi:MAP3K12-binding inhibitory protein 1 isoform X2 [Brachionichthys hirsutus]|uniref:MAP3K12-binding inhibitory protein 1 isoform X2 n=1 Tax=Brachionichthys hirsutus TaxID=412623 RepID=UPI0036047D44